MQLGINNYNICRFSGKKINRKSIKVMPSFSGRNDDEQNTIKIKGSATNAKIYTSNVDYKALEQIRNMCNHPAFKDMPIRIMPDVHPGSGTVVGFSAPASDKIIPGILGTDIGCGMLCVKLDTQGQDIDFKKLDDVVRTYCSVNRTETPNSFDKLSKKLNEDVKEVCRHIHESTADFKELGLGTLGKGNHFIEIDEDNAGQKYLVIHSGSRVFGKKVALHHQAIAQQQNSYFIKELSYLTNDEAKAYLEDMKIARKYAQANRRMIADEILYRMGWKEKESFESAHNYISDSGMIRKGAISADKGEQLIIPLNMRDGAILAKGKGNKDWNSTAPHGAGRQYQRSKARDVISYTEYQKAMNGIYTTCITPSNVDEAPQAYKDSCEIIENIAQTADVEDIISPVYNYKD